MSSNPPTEPAEPCATPDLCRIIAGPQFSTAIYYPPVYDGHGRNLNPDRNRITQVSKCQTCGREFRA